MPNPRNKKKFPSRHRQTHGDHKNANNRLQQDKVISIVSQEFEADISSDEMVLAAGKRHLTDAVDSAEVTRFCNSTVVCNAGGSGLMQHLQDLSSKVSDIDAKHSAQITDLEAKQSTQIANLEGKHSAQIASLDAQVSSLLLFKNYFLDVRERAFLTYLRNYWRDYGASRQKYRPSPNTAASKIHTRISLLNKFILHGGNAEVDSLMFHERRPVQEITPFQCLYGLGPDLIQELASKGQRSILNLLNAAGAVHYENHHMTLAQQEAFDKVIELVRGGNFEEAEDAAKSLFAMNFVELVGATPVNELED